MNKPVLSLVPREQAKVSRATLRCAICGRGRANRYMGKDDERNVFVIHVLCGRCFWV